MLNSRNVPYYICRFGAFGELPGLVERQCGNGGWAVYLIDHFFRSRDLIERLGLGENDLILYIDSSREPECRDFDAVAITVRDHCLKPPAVVVGIGGGTSLDFAKAVSNLLSNGGKAADYQGFDLLPKPSIHKIGVPTLSGTGAESTRTCVMTNHEKSLKLGMNSDHTLFDQLVLDPDLTATVPRLQYFLTGMDTFIHDVEFLSGRQRHPIGDAYARQSLDLCREVFLFKDMMAPENREKMMVASYFGGRAVCHGTVGLIHAFSMALSVVLGTPHGHANCIALLALGEFYQAPLAEFREMQSRQGIEVEKVVGGKLPEKTFDRLFQALQNYEMLLENELSEDFRTILTRDKIREIFTAM